ncbi:MAG: sterol desaturase family protein [Acidobacteria bacterium]|nr:sterol desaturase family protein [Acidobacteriota bacterium]MBI3426892.1 sterol desaturase family protein [Acidobacteriota bacterium]
MKFSPEQFPAFIAVLSLIFLFGLESYFPAARGRRQRWRHACLNLTLGGLSSITIGLLTAPFIAQVMGWAEQSGFGLLRMMLRVIPLPPVAATVAALLLFDAWMYLWHRANHELGFLWRFHRVHHSDPEMDATTAFRFHAGELLLSSLLRLAVLPLLGISLGQLLVYEMLLLPVILFHHSNLRFPAWLDRWIRLVIVTPAIHRVHHSRLKLETDSNYSSIFSCWDRIAGTFRLRLDMTPVNFGLDKYGDAAWQRFSKLLVMPFTPLQENSTVLKSFARFISR